MLLSGFIEAFLPFINKIRGACVVGFAYNGARRSGVVGFAPWGHSLGTDYGIISEEAMVVFVC